MAEMYREFGCYKEELISFTKKGQRGAQEIQEMMQQFRENPPKQLAGSEVVEMIDYKTGIHQNLVTNTADKVHLESSNVLQFITEDGSKISARPSGTEPKIKFYISVKERIDNETDIEAIEKTLSEKVKQIVADLGLEK